MFILSFTFVGVPALTALLQRMERATQNQMNALNAAREAFENVIAEKFRSEGPGWASHRPLTQEKLRALGSHPVLNESGWLEQSYTRGGRDHFERMGANFIETGSAARHAAPHEEGFRNRGTIPDFGKGRIKMLGGRVAARPIFQNFGRAEDRIGLAYERELLREMGL